MITLRAATDGTFVWTARETIDGTPRTVGRILGWATDGTDSEETILAAMVRNIEHNGIRTEPVNAADLVIEWPV